MHGMEQIRVFGPQSVGPERLPAKKGPVPEQSSATLPAFEPKTACSGFTDIRLFGYLASLKTAGKGAGPSGGNDFEDV